MDTKYLHVMVSSYKFDYDELLGYNRYWRYIIPEKIGETEFKEIITEIFEETYVGAKISMWVENFHSGNISTFGEEF